MSDIVFQNKYSFKVPDGEINSGEQVTETAGYIPAERQIADMINAGIRLNEYRGLYDFDSEEDVPDDVMPDPTRSGSMDLADAHQTLMSMNNKQIEINKKKAMADKAAAAAAEEEKRKDREELETLRKEKLEREGNK